MRGLTLSRKRGRGGRGRPSLPMTLRLKTGDRRLATEDRGLVALGLEERPGPLESLFRDEPLELGQGDVLVEVIQIGIQALFLPQGVQAQRYVDRGPEDHVLGDLVLRSRADDLVEPVGGLPEFPLIEPCPGKAESCVNLLRMLLEEALHDPDELLVGSLLEVERTQIVPDGRVIRRGLQPGFKLPDPGRIDRRPCFLRRRFHGGFLPDDPCLFLRRAGCYLKVLNQPFVAVQDGFVQSKKSEAFFAYKPDSPHQEPAAQVPVLESIMAQA